MTGRQGWGGENPWFSAAYTNNRRVGFTYDAAGNATQDGGQTFTYDATGQQASASYAGYSLQQQYDGNTLRVRKTENGAVTYYLRSTVFGGQVVAELNSSGAWARGYVYGGGGLLAVQAGGVYWSHDDPVTKGRRLTDSSRAVTSAVELDPWGGQAGGGWSWNTSQQPRKYTTYERDQNGSDEAMMRRYNRWHARFDQPDPSGGSYDLTDPQSLNRYSYVRNDPVNFTDPAGLDIYCIEDSNGEIRCFVSEVTG
jgi:RHS repeat-associated protein